MREQVEKDRGQALDLMLYFNDRRKALAQPTVTEAEAGTWTTTIYQRDTEMTFIVNEK